jgi:hypothetical protein
LNSTAIRGYQAADGFRLFLHWLSLAADEIKGRMVETIDGQETTPHSDTRLPSGGVPAGV